MINKDGLLFGKINILDVLIVVVIIAAGAFLLMRGGGAVLPQTVSENTYIISFHTPTVEPFVADHFELGDQVIDHVRNINFGTITNIQVGEGIEYHPNAEGVLTESRRGDRVSLEITAEVRAQALDNGLFIQGNRFAVGQSVTIGAGNSVIWVRISALDRA